MVLAISVVAMLFLSPVGGFGCFDGLLDSAVFEGTWVALSVLFVLCVSG